MRRCLSFLVFLLVLALSPSQATLMAQAVYQTDVLVVGGGASGVAAGIQSARMGVKTLVAEPTTWLGGMITSAGVSAFDGNHNLPSGIWAEFREALYRLYGGPNKVATGWVSMTQFEPHAGDSIFKAMAKALPLLQVQYGWQFEKTLVKEKAIIGAIFKQVGTGKKVTVYAKQTIDATEMGDAMASAKIPYDLGMEASAKTGEKVGVPATNNIVQDLTYTAILKNYGLGKDCTMVRPAQYDPAEFDGACTDFYNNKKRLAPNVNAAKMLDYGKLPNGKYMINWPGYGNDIYLNIVEMGVAERERELEKAKQQTYRFIYFIQHQLGFKHLALADDEFPSPDRLPLMPYIREGRRLKGLVRFNINHIAAPFDQKEALYRTGVAVGDYPIDHHHRKNPEAPQHLDFYPVPSYNVPLGSLIPPAFTGLVVAEKGISVSNVVNGTTRLQPVVMMIGQAAGALAALAAKENKPAVLVPVRKLQSTLLGQGVYLMPYFDVSKSHPHFQAVQRIGATGILRGKGIPYKWANQTWFYPDSLVDARALQAHTKDFGEPFVAGSAEFLTQGEALKLCATWLHQPVDALEKSVLNKWSSWGFGPWKPTSSITRVQLAKLLDHCVDPFGRYSINHFGFIKSPYKN